MWQAILATDTDVDWYQFTLAYDLIQAIAGKNAGGKTWSTIFDIDYADGLSRPDTTISVFDANGNLILVSRDSNITDDQPGSGQGADTDDLSRGSFGTLDSFIGSVQMPAGVVPAGSISTYYVAISSNAQLASAMDATFDIGSTNALVRLEPVNSVTRIAEDHVGFSGHVTGDPAGGASLVAPVQSLFDDIADAVSLDTHVLPFTLGDAVLYVSQGNSSSPSMHRPAHEKPPSAICREVTATFWTSPCVRTDSCSALNRCPALPIRPATWYRSTGPMQRSRPSAATASPISIRRLIRPTRNN